MSTALLDLASPVFLSVATFRRKAKRGDAITGDEVHDEMVQVFREQDQRAEVESELGTAWQQAKNPLAYLVDEVMMNTEWEYRGWWTDNCLEAELLGHPQKMRGIKFYDDLEAAKKQFDEASKSSGPQRGRSIDLLTIFYCCLRFGFEGKYAGQPQELDREAQQILSLLPAAGRTATREFFSEAYKHTIEIPPNYETVMRLATLVAIMIGMVILFFGLREVLWSQLVDDLTEHAEMVGDYFSNKT